MCIVLVHTLTTHHAERNHLLPREMQEAFLEAIYVHFADSVCPLKQIYHPQAIILHIFVQISSTSVQIHDNTNQ